MADVEVLRLVYMDAQVAEKNARAALAAIEQYRRDAEREYHKAVIAHERLNTEEAK